MAGDFKLSATLRGHEEDVRKDVTQSFLVWFIVLLAHVTLQAITTLPTV